jgi:hypothetical protein
LRRRRRRHRRTRASLPSEMEGEGSIHRSIETTQFFKHQFGMQALPPGAPLYPSRVVQANVFQADGRAQNGAAVMGAAAPLCFRGSFERGARARGELQGVWLAPDRPFAPGRNPITIAGLILFVHVSDREAAAGFLGQDR